MNKRLVKLSDIGYTYDPDTNKTLVRATITESVDGKDETFATADVIAYFNTLYGNFDRLGQEYAAKVLELEGKLADANSQLAALKTHKQIDKQKIKTYLESALNELK